MSSPPPPPPKKASSFLDTIQPFVIGGISGMCATSVIQPIDTIKVRIQLLSEQKHLSKESSSLSPFAVAKMIHQKEGIIGFYKGLDSAMLRQATYATARLGIYKTIVEDIKHKQQKSEITLFEKSYASIIAGFLGSLIGNPMDLILVRFQSDAMNPPAERRNYKNVFDALSRIIKEEGVLTLWRGSTPTVIRAIAMNLGTLMPYDEVKDQLNKWTGNKQETTEKRLIASAVSGAVGSVMSLPFDNIKTKLQRMKKGPDGQYPYNGFMACLLKSVKNEGITGLWVGLPTFYVRVAPHAMVTLLVQDFLTDAAKKFRNKH